VNDQESFYYGIAAVLLVPPVWILVSTWFQWIGANKKSTSRGAILVTRWRAEFLRYGLFCASAAMICLTPVSFHLSQYNEDPLPGYWHVAFRTSFYLWALALIGTAFGKGTGRSRLIWWVVTIPLCLFIIIFESMMD